METYYICTSQGTYNLRLKTHSTYFTEQTNYFILDSDNTFLETSLKIMYPTLDYMYVLENTEGLFLQIIEKNKTKHEYKLFKTTRTDFIEDLDENITKNTKWCSLS